MRCRGHMGTTRPTGQGGTSASLSLPQTGRGSLRPRPASLCLRTSHPLPASASTPGSAGQLSEGRLGCGQALHDPGGLTSALFPQWRALSGGDFICPPGSPERGQGRGGSGGGRQPRLLLLWVRWGPSPHWVPSPLACRLWG